MKKTLLTVLTLLSALSFLFSQDQTINGNLRVGAYVSGTDSAVEGARLYFSGAKENHDPIWLSRFNVRPDATELRVVVGDNYGSGGDKFSVGAIKLQDSKYYPVMVVTSSGMVGINTDNPTTALSVNGVITARQVKITTQGWADYVFDSAYRLRPLQEIADSIKYYRHLPGMPSEKQLVAEGLDVGDMARMQQEKIEELTLYLIQQEKTQQQMMRMITAQQQQLQKKACLEERLQEQEKKLKALRNLMNANQ